MHQSVLYFLLLWSWRWWLFRIGGSVSWFCISCLFRLPMRREIILAKDTKRSMKKTLTASVGLALVGTGSIAGAANAITANDAKPQNFEGAVSA